MIITETFTSANIRIIIVEAVFTRFSMDKKAITDKIKEDIKSGALSETEVPDAMNLKQYPGIRVNGWQEV